MVEGSRVVVLKGDDASLLSQALQTVVSDLVGSGDRSLMVEEVGEQHYVPEGKSEPDLVPLITAAQTPPFLTERRVVIGRNMGLFTKQDQVASLVAWLGSPAPTTDLVLVWEKGANSPRLGAMPKTLKAAIKACGGHEIDAAPAGKGRRMLLDERLSEAPIRLDASARKLIVETLGDDVGRARPLIEALISTYGEGARLTVADVQPFVGQASDVPPWELTDAVDGGDITTALAKLRRMLSGGEKHPLVVLATLHNHYQRALALEGAGARDEREAAAILGIKGSTFPAKKALQLGRQLGPERIRGAVLLLADADLDVRGRSAIPADVITEVLVARLARLSR